MTWHRAALKRPICGAEIDASQQFITEIKMIQTKNFKEEL